MRSRIPVFYAYVCIPRGAILVETARSMTGVTARPQSDIKGRRHLTRGEEAHGGGEEEERLDLRRFRRAEGQRGRAFTSEKCGMPQDRVSRQWRSRLPRGNAKTDFRLEIMRGKTTTMGWFSKNQVRCLPPQPMLVDQCLNPWVDFQSI